MDSLGGRRFAGDLFEEEFKGEGTAAADGNPHGREPGFGGGGNVEVVDAHHADVFRAVVAERPGAGEHADCHEIVVGDDGGGAAGDDRCGGSQAAVDRCVLVAHGDQFNAPLVTEARDGGNALAVGP